MYNYFLFGNCLMPTQLSFTNPSKGLVNICTSTKRTYCRVAYGMYKSRRLASEYLLRKFYPSYVPDPSGNRTRSIVVPRKYPSKLAIGWQNLHHSIDL